MKVYDFIKICTITMVLIAYTPMAQNEIVQENATPKILFLTCSVLYDPALQDYKMELRNKRIVKGKLKNIAEEQGKGDFSYRTLDQKSQIITEKYIPWPIDKIIEYVDEEGRLQKKSVRLDSAEVLLRLQLTPETHSIAFDKHQQLHSGLSKRTAVESQQLLLINLND